MPYPYPYTTSYADNKNLSTQNSKSGKKSCFASMMLAASIPAVFASFNLGYGPGSESSGNPTEPSRSDLTGSLQILGSLAITAYILGFGVSPGQIGPLSDLYGRAVILRLSMVGFTLTTTACGAAPSLGALAGLRFVAGIFAGVPMTIGGAVVADLYREGRRHGPMTAFNIGSMIAPTLGPVAGGWITYAIGWRWAMWIAGLLALAGTIVLFILPETHLPTIARRFQNRLNKLANPTATPPPRPTISQALRSIYVANKLILAVFWHPSTALMSILIFIFFGSVDVVLSSLGTVMRVRYGFLTNDGGLSYLGIGTGAVCSMLIARPLHNSFLSLLRRLRHQPPPQPSKDGQPPPDADPRDELLYIFATLPFFAAGMIWYGWSLQSASSPWIVSLLGLFLYGFAYMLLRVRFTLLPPPRNLHNY